MPKLKRPDGKIVSVSKAGREALLARGYTEIDQPAGRARSAAPQPPAEPATLPERPADSDLKSDWVAYATARGVENADDLTKADLIDKVG